ncbi:MAG: glycosyltransferase [Hyphomonadaceae bacterium]|nr:MAG: group 1 glycosyl transferase [Caulobacteraceae bacterium]MBT9446589.1 glycosyltransferase [Hyphomonadaceae bacterium]TPW02193.1 MAG: group 1 glycosyl transferase [Alphaproteobacteria bacterium]
MKILFVHNNFPAQFVHLAPALKARGHEVFAIGSHTARAVEGIALSTYKLNRGTTKDILPLAVRYEADCMRGAATAQVADALKQKGLTPDLVVAHNGWGETLFLDDVWPGVKQLLYAEFFTGPRDLDVGFDPEFGAMDLGRSIRVRAKNGALALSMLAATRAVAPTAFQRDTFPEDIRQRIEVIHDGIDTASAAPRADARLAIPGTDLVFRPGDEVITNINRHLEPLRGLHVFLRALPRVLAERPNAHVVIIGDTDGVAYGAPPPAGRTWKDIYLSELEGRLDLSRVHFLGRVPRRTYLDALAVSAAHVYLTYPFVLSWSLLEAMSAGCLVIASDTAPVREAVQHECNGLMVDFFDVEALSGRLVDALAAPDRYRAMRAQARADALARYDLSTVCLPRMVTLAESMT